MFFKERKNGHTYENHLKIFRAMLLVIFDGLGFPFHIKWRAI
jgi:hypothetical protein